MHRVDYLADAELRELQNANLFHLCPSETEGFGHYIVEALSVGAVVLTTDAAPMNELVTEERGVLIPYSHTDRQHLATRYLVDAQALEAAVSTVLAMDDAAIQAKQEAARAFFLDNDAVFRTRLVEAVAAMVGQPRSAGARDLRIAVSRVFKAEMEMAPQGAISLPRSTLTPCRPAHGRARRHAVRRNGPRHRWCAEPASRACRRARCSCSSLHAKSVAGVACTHRKERVASHGVAQDQVPRP